MRNAAATLTACLRSILRQSESDWQCIIVDDGSQDDSVNRARCFAELDPRFRLIETAPHGLVEALNTGWPYCSGPFIARMDADDIMHRHRLAMQVYLLEANPSLAAVGCHVRLFPRRRLRDGRLAYERWLNRITSAHRIREDAFIECPIAHPTLMIRRDVLSIFGYRDCGWPEDYDLILRLLTCGHTIDMVPKRLLSWRDHPTRLSRTSQVYSIAQFTACKAAFLATSFLAATNTYILWGYGGTGKALRRALAKHGKHPAYIVELHPRRLGRTVHRAPVIPPEALLRTPRHPVVVSVAGERARGEIRAAMQAMEFQELRDFVCAA
jgi:cellulose synthase/poly-beta-1,6-N-acetylglucosamine synthase-like glycosyltransferase